MKFESTLSQNCSYENSMLLQSDAIERVSKNNLLICLGFEYRGVITLGRRAVDQTEILDSMHGFDVQKIDRGGRATLHNQGQLVIYPIFDLRHSEIGVRQFIQLLNHTNVRLLKSYGIDSFYSEEQGGVLTVQGKISFTGLRIQQGVSSHGISINVSNSLNDFSSIVACGNTNPSFDRIENHMRGVSLAEVFQKWNELLREEFSSLQKQEIRGFLS